MTSVSDEVELKYDVDPDVDLAPVLSRAAAAVEGVLFEPGVGGRHHEATYFDTEDHRLQAGRLTVRRRTGGPDAGWHLKVPGGEAARVEVRLPLGRAVRTVPAPLRSLVWVRSCGEALVPVAEIITDRTVSTFVAEDGRVLAEVADDRVSARRLGTAEDRMVSWREMEVELVEGDASLLAALDEQLREAGLAHAGSASKLARVLGRAGDGPEVAPLTPDSAGGEVVLAYLAAQAEQLKAQDPLVRLDRPDSVHKMRVATRRLRSGLQTFGPFLDKATSRPLREELKWLAGRLGEARDAEVMRDRLDRAVRADDSGPRAAEPPAGVDQLAETYREAHDRVLLDLDSERYHGVVGSLDALLAQPALRGKAEHPAREVLPPRVKRSYADLRAEMRTAASAPTSEERSHHLHEARKAAKRARYAAEALVDAFGEEAVAFAAAMEGLQEVLGEHQDSVVMREHLTELVPGATAQDAFTYGRLHAQEQARGDLAREQAMQRWEEASAKSLRRWLRSGH